MAGDITDDKGPNPTVFLSYSWSSQEHIEHVRAIASKLMADGVNVLLDQWELKPGHDLNVYMERMVVDPKVDKVVVVCDAHYADKANGRRGGVGTESQIISNEVYQKVDQEKFIAVIMEWVEGHPTLPVFLRSRLSIDFSTPEKEYENYDSLVRAIYGRPLHRKPTLGNPPSRIFEEGVVPTTTRPLLEYLRSALREGKPSSDGILADYRERFVESLGSLRDIDDENAQYDDFVVDGIRQSLPWRDEAIEFFLLLARYGDESRVFEEVRELFESMTKYVNGEKAEHCAFLIHEMFLYFSASCFRAKLYAGLDVFLSNDFYVYNKTGERAFSRYGQFRPYLRALEERRNQRLYEGRRLSVVADLLQERAVHSKISFDDIANVDVLLYFRSILGDEPNRMWYPDTITHRGRVKDTPFSWAESERNFQCVKKVLGVPMQTTGIELGELLKERDAFGRLRTGGFWLHPRDIVDFERLGTRR